MFGWVNMLGSFTSPVEIGLNPYSTLWLFPLLLSISLVYKATKIREICSARFVREVIMLFATISVTMVLLGIGLFLVSFLFT